MRSKKLPGCRRVKVSHARERERQRHLFSFSPSFSSSSLIRLAAEIYPKDHPGLMGWLMLHMLQTRLADYETYVTANCVCVAGICNFFCAEFRVKMDTPANTCELAGYPNSANAMTMNKCASQLHPANNICCQSAFNRFHTAAEIL